MTTPAESASPIPPAIPGVDSFILEPPGLGVALRISIARSTAAPDLSLGVAYVTDADMSFGTAVEQARLLTVGGEMAPVAVVGIGYAAETGDYAFAGVRRGLDFYGGTPRTIVLPGAGEVRLGGAARFLQAIREHVIPAVETRVARIDPSRRVLFGASAGGHFAAFALTQAPDAFAGYAMMSPNFKDFPPAPGDAPLVKAVQALPAGAVPPGTRVFLSAGEHEEEPGTPLAAVGIITNIARMQAALEAHGIATQRLVFPGESHTSVTGAAISRAFRFLFPPTTPSTWQERLGAARIKE